MPLGKQTFFVVEVMELIQFFENTDVNNIKYKIVRMTS